MDADLHTDSRCSSTTLATPAKFVSQMGKKIHPGSRRSTSSQRLSFDELEQGASKYDKHNPLNFGQIVAIDDDDLLQFSTHGARALEPAEELELGLDGDLVTSPGFLRQVSKKIYHGSRRLSSSSRRLSLEQLEQGGPKYYKQNSLTFGQVVAVNDDELLHFSTHDAEAQAPADVEQQLELGLKSGDKGSHGDVFQQNFIQELSNIGEIPKQSKFDSNGGDTAASAHAISSGRKSRLETIILEQCWFTVYKRLFVISFTINIIGLVLAITGYLPYAKSRATLFSVANILMAVSVRNEVFLRILFWVAVHLLGTRWVPVQIKTMVTAFLQSVGGIHSGCGLAAMMWLVYALVQSFLNRENYSYWIHGVACGILFLLFVSSLAAFPVFRHIHHNFFERVHRFAGWSSLVLVWAYIVLSAFWDPDSQSYQMTAKSRRTNLVKMQSLWLTAATTTMIILPWLTVRRVAVETVVPPSKVNSLLHFKGGVKAGLLARISPSPFSEWHAFGIISDGQERHTILAGAVGDFTKSLVDSPPTHIWVRTFHFAGLPYLINMYEKAVLVATGSGICVFLSFLMQSTRAEVHIIWIAKNIKESFGEGIGEVIKETPADKLTVIDTAVSGRPRTKELVVRKAKESGAQVVIVTSNPRGTNEIVSGCNAVGIPAFGPIWDS